MITSRNIFLFLHYYFVGSNPDITNNEGANVDTFNSTILHIPDNVAYKNSFAPICYSPWNSEHVPIIMFRNFNGKWLLSANIF